MPGGGRIRIGTCSWADRGLVASGWYPPSARTAAARLAFYGAAFDTVEVDSTFYAIPEQASAFQWAARTPPGFLFNVKAWGLFTWHSVKYETLPEWVRHEIPRPESGRLDFQGLPRELRPVLWKRFTSALEPLRTMDRMGYLLFQLPPKASFSPVMMRYLERVAEVTPPFRTAVEVRNRSWMEKGNRESFLSLLKGANMAYVAVDEPELDWTVGRDFPVTATWGAVARFHGRNREGWTKKGATVAEKFRYNYSDGELLSWEGAVRDAAERAGKVFLMFNNCYRDYAVKNALRMKCLLGVACSPGEGVQGELSFGE
ncbi:uncharacterized protein YecE (DUF72 family) [Aminivibrio pyruvatiphilus]|jgi:uncharacterized protein YecE (DUF72 family)|uniref:Uncharacterized protein YecE (DUF72 family) n=1 Tax=Aminivibrio pyruvatiphilus TaxID=1005740 RepID=A0A4R8M5N2_9BACT|nr:DUF72 domain-containing protein [Aminivibrio pyruvatiphilus]TDY57988.1 uncharacterized protein YecE (DUF72 family) [Aminivibrio pyruvatiphilus]